MSIYPGSTHRIISQQTLNALCDGGVKDILILPTLRSVRPSSTFKIDIYRKGALIYCKEHHIGGLCGNAGELIQNGMFLYYNHASSQAKFFLPFILLDVTHSLVDKNGHKIPGHIELKLTLDSFAPLPTGDPGLTLANDMISLADAALDRLDRPSDGSAPFRSVSNYVDQAATVTGKVEMAANSALMLGGSAGPLGQALQSLARVVEIVDGIVEVSEIS